MVTGDTKACMGRRYDADSCVIDITKCIIAREADSDILSCPANVQCFRVYNAGSTILHTANTTHSLG